MVETGVPFIKPLYSCKILPTVYEDSLSYSEQICKMIAKLNELIEYVNNVTADVYYEIDSIQSWLKDITFSMCFVEREHMSDDTIGKHTVPEQVEIGSYVFDTSLTDYGHCSLFDNNGSNWSIIVVATVTLNQQQEIVPATGRMYGKMYTGLAFNRFTSASAANTFIDNVTQNLA